MAASSADFVVVGAGIAGASVAYELSAKGKVVLLEMEIAPGYHSTGRSAAIMSENYGPAHWSRLVTASRSFLERPPELFTEVPLVSPRGALFLAHDDEIEALHTQEQEMRRRGAAVEFMSTRDALRHCPVLRPEAFALALYEPDCMDIDTNALMSAYLRAFRARGGTLFTEAHAEKIARAARHWTVTTPSGLFQAPVLINAAGAWVQQIATLAGLPRRNVLPFRRTAVTFEPPAASNSRTWPMTFDVGETFYFKPEAGRIMVSPVDMAPSEPCDAQADELEVAIAVDRIQTFTTMEVRAIKHKWGGLRTFAPDHEPVIGPDPAEQSFIWLAGQGGNGVMGGAAAARLAASLATGGDIPSDISALGVSVESVSPGRKCVSEIPSSSPLVG